MHRQKIGWEIAIVQQATISLTFILILAGASFVFAENEISVKSVSFLLAIYLFLGTIIWFVFLFVDISLTDGNIVMKKMTGTKTRPISDFKTIESAFRSVFYIEFNDSKKVFFYLTLQQKFDMMNGVDVAKDLIEIIRKEKQTYTEA